MDNLQLFGGGWTEDKLQVLDRYLRAYAQALKKQRFELVYIDAFAGTGYREQRLDVATGSIFEDVRDENPQQFLAGSARIALRVEPAFHRYVFVEKRKAKVAELERLKLEFPSKADRIEIRCADANDAVMKLCVELTTDQRGVLFLDPFGMQVNWSTIEAVAATRKLDVWILFPFSVNRLLARAAEEMPAEHVEALNRFFGSREWFERFYRQSIRSNIFFGDELQIEKACSLDSVARFYEEKLAALFPALASKVLRNSRNQPLFQLFFVASNPKGSEIALRIAAHILHNM